MTNVQSSLRALRVSRELRPSTIEDWANEFEIVKVVKVHSEGEGGSITIFVPSLGHERSTIKNRLKFGAAAVTAHRTKNEASSNEPISIGHKSKDKSTRNIRRSGKFAPAVVHVL